jgi:hypothetical protein
MDGFDFEWGGDGEDTGGGGGGGGGIDLSGVDLSGIDFENSPIDLSNILNGTIDTSSLLGGDTGKPNVFDFDQQAPPSNIAELLSSMNSSSPENLSKTDWNSVYNQGLSDDEIAKREDMSKYANDRIQDFGGDNVTKNFDSYNNNLSDIMDNKGGFTSQWQTSGSDRIMVNDDGTGIGINTETGESYALSKNQVDKMVANNQIDTKGSGYVDATGGNGYVPGGGKTITNPDGTKTVITTDGKVYTLTTDGKVVDTGKVVNPNNSKIETDPTKVVSPSTNTNTNTKTTSTSLKPDTKTQPAAKDNNMLMMLLAMMAMMNKGGGSSTGSGGSIPSLQANRTQLPYGQTAARPGAGGVNYFSPTNYTQKAAGGGMMYGGGGISDLGGYSDGGRLLKGPGDGVSDSIPATIGGKQPARLATGEFVVPARVVSELGNGSTDAGAQKLYAMMDRVQKARRQTKNVAADTKAHKYLPA